MRLSTFVDSITGFDEFNNARQIDCIAYFLTIISGNTHFTATTMVQYIAALRLPISVSYINKYLAKYTYGQKLAPKIPVKFIQNNHGYQLTRPFEKELRQIFEVKKEVPFKNYDVPQDITPSSIPFINNKISSNAEFFSRMYYQFYHLENSIRSFLRQRLNDLYKGEWESKLLESVDLQKALAIKKETDLSKMISNRGDNILFYCMWTDYGKILKSIPNIMQNEDERDEILAHLSTLTKIRNAIAHNVETIPDKYLKELDLFIDKYIHLFPQSN